MAKKSQRNIQVTQRVKDILRALDHSPLPADLLLEVSRTFGTPAAPDGGFSTVRRVREKMHDLSAWWLPSLH